MSLQIKPLVDLPVGQNFQDKVQAFVTFSINETLVFNPKRDLTIQNATDYMREGKGDLFILYIQNNQLCLKFRVILYGLQDR